MHTPPSRCCCMRCNVRKRVASNLMQRDKLSKTMPHSGRTPLHTFDAVPEMQVRRCAWPLGRWQLRAGCTCKQKALLF